jgi:alpha-tubulin suppressor-like RCC1 family protein
MDPKGRGEAKSPPAPAVQAAEDGAERLLDDETLSGGDLMKRLTLHAAVAVLVLGTGCDSNPVTVPDRPTVVVSPTEASIEVGGTQQFSVVVRDGSGTVVSAPQLSWSSDAGSVAGVDGSGRATGLQKGTARIKVDYQNVSATAVLAVRTPPSVQITGPANGTVVDPGAAIAFRGTATNSENAALAGAALVWTSDIEGSLGTGASVDRDDLRPGVHRIVLTATDAAGLSGNDSVSIEVVAPPTVQITAPAHQARFATESEISFTGSATASTGESLTGAALVWSSSRDGVLGTGTGVASAALSAGVHVVRLTATDAQGLVGIDSISLTILAIIRETITAGERHSCGLTRAGAAYCWGANHHGQLGDGSLESRTTPVAVAGGHVFVAIDAGDAHTVALTGEGTAYAWGMNQDGRLGDGTALQRTTPVAVAGNHIFTTISAGYNNTAAVSASGAAYVWGWNERGKGGDGTSTGQRLVPTAVAGEMTFRSISAGRNHTIAVTPAGVAFAWGWNRYGGLGDGTTTDRHVPTPVAGGLTFITAAAGNYHTVAIATSGQAYGWGWNESGMVGDGTTTDRHAPVPVAGGLTFVSIRAGHHHNIALTAAGAAYGWGLNWQGRLGDGTMASGLVPVDVSGGLLFRWVGAGGAHSVGLTEGRDAFGWGWNEMGQVGDGTTTSRDVPTAVLGDFR